MLAACDAIQVCRIREKQLGPCPHVRWYFYKHNFSTHQFKIIPIRTNSDLRICFALFCCFQWMQQKNLKVLYFFFVEPECLEKKLITVLDNIQPPRCITKCCRTPRNAVIYFLCGGFSLFPWQLFCQITLHHDCILLQQRVAPPPCRHSEPFLLNSLDLSDYG